MTSSADPAPTARARIAAYLRSPRHRQVLLAVFLAMLAVIRAGAPDERDPYWSARAGWENLTGTPLAREDTWSWSADGVWYPNSPAWNLVLGAAWHWLGYWGLFVAGLASLALYFWLAWLLAAKLGARALPGLLGAAGPLLLSLPWLSARATVVVQSLILAGVLFAVWWGERATRVPAWAATAVAFAVAAVGSLAGSWIHLSFLLVSVALAVIWALIWGLTPELPRPRAAAMAGAGAVGVLLGLIVSPYGLQETIERSQAVQQACVGLILEWSSVFQISMPKWYVTAAAAVVLALATAMWALRMARAQKSALRFLLPLVAIGLPAAFAGVGMARFLGVALMTLAPAAAALATRVADWVHLQTRRTRTGFWARPRVAEYTSGGMWTIVLTGVAIVLLPVALLTGGRGARPPELGVIERLPIGCLLVSDGAVAGPVILSRPDVEVWIDGRADFYGREHLARAYRVYGGVDPIPDEATCAVFPLPTRDYPVAAPQHELDTDPAWTALAEQDGYRAWVRR